MCFTLNTVEGRNEINRLTPSHFKEDGYVEKAVILEEVIEFF